jgi:uncharacterized protein YkwD
MTDTTEIQALLDDIMRTDGGWRFTRRTFVPVLMASDTVVGNVLTERPSQAPGERWGVLRFGFASSTLAARNVSTLTAAGGHRIRRQFDGAVGRGYMARKLAVVVAAAAIAFVAAGCVTSQDTLSAINADRASAGAAVVQQAGDLDGVAQNWANYLRDSNSFSHQDIAAVKAWSPYAWMGETLAKVPVDYTGAQVEAIWMKDAQHRAIVLDPRYRYVGIGIASNQSDTWVVAVFGGR